MTQEYGKVRALLVQADDDSFGELKSALENQGVETYRARSCVEAGRILAKTNVPQVVFTDANLPDGTWAEVVAAAGKSQSPLNVILVSRVLDVSLYIRALEGGAFDFIVPPFLGSDLTHIVHCAAGGALSHSGSRARRVTVA